MKVFNLGIVGMIAVSVWAQPTVLLAECPHAEAIQDESYAVRAPARLVHGVLNVLSSPVQLFSEPQHTIQCKKPDLILGIADGVIATGKYLILGVWDVGTFWVPGSAGKSLAVTECGWEQAARDCSAASNQSQESKPAE